LGTLRVECVSRVNDLAGRVEEAHGIARLLEGRRVDLNEVPADLLETLPGIGPVRARAIVVARPFVSLADLERVPGIGPKTRARIERWLEVMPETANSRFANEGANRDG
jgi:DNA uptake protein ComE-like DNA-binding protein